MKVFEKRKAAGASFEMVSMPENADEEGNSDGSARNTQLLQIENDTLHARVRCLRIINWALVFFMAVVLLVAAVARPRQKSATVSNEQPLPDISQELLAEIDSKQDDILAIANELSESSRHHAYERIAWLSDTYGPRIAGSTVLESAIDGVVEKLREHGLENVHTEEAVVPHWVRGQESATLLSPLVGGNTLELAMLGLGTSIGTQGFPNGTLEAAGVVVNSLEELRATKNVSGAIVVFNQQYMGYGKTVRYRYSGASWASERGAVGVLVRTIAPFSLRTPHTGGNKYLPGVTPIPAACIAAEDAMMLARMQKRGSQIRIRLKMEAENHPYVKSRNVVAEWTGAEEMQKEEVVLVSGHFDSWDVGYGSMDDGGGAMISWQALLLLKALNLRPRRTVRLVLWTSEEFGCQGSKQYWADHKAEVEKFIMVMESDGGVFEPSGLSFTGGDAARAILQHIGARLLKPAMLVLTEAQVRDGSRAALANYSRVYSAVGSDGGGEDIEEFVKAGVPGASPANHANPTYTGPGSRDYGSSVNLAGGALGTADHFQGDYFFYHHSVADSPDKMDAGQIDRCVLLWATYLYVVADLKEALPRVAGDERG